MRSLLFVVGAWVLAAVTDLTPKAALATGANATAGVANATATAGVANATDAEATSPGAAATSAAVVTPPPTDSTQTAETPGPSPPTDFALPLVIGGLCALTLAAMGAGALLRRRCRRAARDRRRVSYLYA
ncbi:envelope glycoprotein J [Macacine alphaherpesvirus 1]|uniref:Envelope glycoprotein J n=2 Tax=Simplexvirus TaxID=10294 RepID=A0A1X9WF55_9ALPH|nr:envelope glycoprotein J [Macacine alphaherpesvirus 1]AAF62544.1 glycoprotein gJ [Macacine alphaherpesvirus 1]ARS01701.1 envelope glycoprotein J [Macacine alphaherpesvirus 2]